MIAFAPIRLSGLLQAQTGCLLLGLFMLFQGDLRGQSTSFWGSVTPEQKTASKEEIEKTLQLIRSIPFPDTTFQDCPALPNFGDPTSTAHLDKYLGLTLQLQRQGRPNCALEICEALLRQVPASNTELRARLLAEEVAVLFRYGDFGKAEAPAKALISLVEKSQISNPATLLTTAQYLHLKANASDRALALVQTVLDTARAKKDSYWEMRSLSLMGGISRDIYFGASLRAVPYHEAALKIAEARRDTAAMMGEWMSLALNYGDAGQQSKFLEYVRNSVGYLTQFKDVRRVLSAWMSISLQLSNADRLEESNDFLYRIRAVGQALHLTEIARDADLRLYEHFMALEKYEEAGAALLRASDGVTDGSKLSEQFYQLAKANKQHEKALFYLEKAYSEVGERYLGRNAAELSRMETQYGTREKERILIEKEALLATNSRQRSLLLIFSALITLLLAGAIWRYTREIKVRKVLAKQNKIIELQTVELRNLDKLKSRFFANVSHELRTPLTLMLGPIGTVLHDASLTEKNTVLLQSARKSGKQLLGLIREILDLSKLEAGRMSLNETPTNLYELLRFLYVQFESHARFKGIDLEYQNLIDSNIYVLLDKKKTEHIVSNLLSNALKFTDKGGKITLLCGQEQDEIQITVQDNGRGIHPDDLPHIFERFYQGSHGSLSAEGGTGIGLSLSAELAELMGGTLSVESVPGKGSTFFCKLPYCKTEAAAGMQNNHLEEQEEGSLLQLIATSGAPKTHLPKILVVEDNPGLQQFLTLILQEKFVVECAGNGQEALDWLFSRGATQLPSLILSDVMMPQMDGFQLLEHLKNDDRYRHLPVIMLTARAELADKLHALRMGVDDYMLKPFDEEELIARVENLLKFANLRYGIHKKNITAIEGGNRVTDSETMTLSAAPQLLSEGDAQWLKQLEENIKTNIEHPHLSVEFLAEQMIVSARHLQRQIKTISGLNIHQYLQEARLQHSRHLLERSKLMVKQVSAKVGYRDVKHFARLYKERFGKLPSREE